MKSFIDNAVERVLSLEFSPENLVLVFPSQRAGLFFKKKWIEKLTTNTTILPEIIGIEFFIQELSELVIEKNEELLLHFFSIYKNTFPNEGKKDLESFLSWGQTLLADFNEIDRYLVDHNYFFNYLYFVKDQEHWFLSENKTKLVESYIAFWDKLKQYYKEFVDFLKNHHIGYQGLQYRCAVENLDKLLKNKKHYIFIGFNALNEAEQTIFNTLYKAQKASFIWDIDKYFFENKFHDASYFLRKNFKTLGKGIIQQIDFHNSFEKNKEIKIYGIPKNIGQVKYIGQLLSKYSIEDLNKTAIILAHETLLTPLLNSLPQNVTNVNITMGKPLSHSPFTNLINTIFSLFQNQKENSFFYKDVLNIIGDNAVSSFLGEENCKIIETYILKNNLTRILSKKLLLNKNWELIFSNYSNNLNFINNIKLFLIHISEIYKKEKKILLLSYCNSFSLLFEELELLIKNNENINTLKLLFQFYKMKLSSKTIDYKGEPFQGLQIMGVLESRCLDFENLIILSVNEGKLPSANKGNSFIPYDLKREVNLPTYKEKDAIYAYHFYRLLQRAQSVCLTYNTEVSELNSGEKSRFIQQLELQPHSNHKVISQLIASSSFLNYKKINKINKTSNVFKKLKVIFNNGISPSALNTYLRDEIQFYERYILGVKEVDKIEENIASNTMGTIIHNVLEHFYKPFEGKLLRVHDIDDMLRRIHHETVEQFSKEFSDIQIVNGVNFLSFEASKEFIKKFLLQEKQLLNEGNELQIVSVEKQYKTKIEIPELDFPIFIKGKVDRVDRYNGKLRVIDYKTGRVEASKLKISDWNLIRTDEGYSKALQILMYAHMYCSENNFHGTVQGGIISFKKLNNGVLNFGVKENRNKSNPDINSETFLLFLEQLSLLIQEICDINQPFRSNEFKNS